MRNGQGTWRAIMTDTDLAGFRDTLADSSADVFTSRTETGFTSSAVFCNPGVGIGVVAHSFNELGIPSFR
ncbi:hypothetical protein NDU88_002520 [Pleurodeles waltl]|uniref:Uncharacterized protein n=1 Tax=Pleurodeles waltl TaxID=8319 RepID=A0AAV7LFT7_PLEWA|nr:hypothetical protein NDU88_002520 [Pleurodeles waltl]